MEVFISAPGDLSVGINGASARIEFDGEFISQEERKWFREDVGKLFNELFDLGKPYVVFGDECDYCGATLCAGKCHSCLLRDM